MRKNALKLRNNLLKIGIEAGREFFLRIHRYSSFPDVLQA
jgi:hypothetical protein